MKLLFKAVCFFGLGCFALVANPVSSYAACTNPAGTEGQQVYNASHKSMQYCDGTDWVSMKGGIVDILSNLSCSSGEVVKWNGSAWACATDNDTAKTDILAGISCSSGEVVKWNGSAWACAADIDTTDNLGNHTATQDLDMATSLITNTGAPSASTDIATKAYIDGLTGANETDPKVNTLTSGKWCLTNGSVINCTVTPVVDTDTDVISTLSCSNDEVAKWNGSAWACAADIDTDTGMTALTGDVTGSGSGSVATTIAANAVTSAKILNGTIVNGDIANTTIALGKLNATGTPGSTKFLRGDGTWNVLTGADDNLGNHTATTTLDMNGGAITNASSITATGDIYGNNLYSNVDANFAIAPDGTSGTDNITTIMSTDSTSTGAYISLYGRTVGGATYGRIYIVAGGTNVNDTSGVILGRKRDTGGTSTSALFISRANGDFVVYGSAKNCVIGSGTGTTACTSDERIKKDIEVIPDALEKISQIRGVTYHWKEDSGYDDKGEKLIGFIAQDVQKVFPEAVMHLDEDKPDMAYLGENGNHLKNHLVVATDSLIPPLVEAVKELKKRSDDRRKLYEAGVKELRAEIETLKKEKE